MISRTLNDVTDVERMRELIASLGAGSTVVDFEEMIQIASIRSCMRLWEHAGKLVGFACVDPFNNLWFDTLPVFPELTRVEDECITWGVTCMQEQNANSGENNTLDSSCMSTDEHRIAILEGHGFARTDVRTLHYSRRLDGAVPVHPLPAGFSIRPSIGIDEVEELVELHRQAFGTDHMTVEQRLAIMRAPGYIPELDLVVEAPEGKLAAFCIGGYSDEGHTTGTTDPIGTAPAYQGLGLSKAVISTCMQRLQRSGARVVELGTSSDNVPMQKLAEALGFRCISEKVWFERSV